MPQPRRCFDTANDDSPRLRTVDIFHALDFAAATEVDLPKFQYIVAHGVYAWIDEAAAASLRRFVDRHLAPGGLVYVSYNAMPGWAAKLPKGEGVILHVSGCAKGCARPAATAATFAATATGYDLILDGRAGDSPTRRGLSSAAVARLLGGEGANMFAGAG